MSLNVYEKKRDFRKTREPRGKQRRRSRGSRLYVCQKHDASRLHYDFRLELDGALKSWAVPKGPSIDPGSKRLAVHVEDHPLEYGKFEGTIPEGEYGAGTVLIWDRGSWEPHGDPQEGYEKGKLSFDLKGEKLNGAWTLVRMKGERSGDGKNWLLIKSDDTFASGKKADDPTRKQPESVATGRSLRDLGKGNGNGAVSKRSRDGNPSPEVKLAEGLAPMKNRQEDEAIALDDAGEIDGVRKGSPPKSLRPQLATLMNEVPKGDQWLHEVKFDGYRMLAQRTGRKWKLITRNGKDWTSRFPVIAETLDGIDIKEGVLDGEVVVLRKNGVSDFQALQNAMRRDAHKRMYYFVFDLLFCNGFDLRGAGLLDRKRVLRAVLGGIDSSTSHLRYSDHVVGKGEDIYRQACKAALEGLIAKRVDAPYVHKRSKSWLKIKCSQRQEFVIVGYTEPKGSRKGLGALLVGVHEGKTLRYSGKVGTGFDEETLLDLHRTLSRRERKDPEVKGVPRADARGAHWVKPDIVAEIEFTEWTSDNRLRHPVYHGLRDDKPAKQVKREVRDGVSGVSNREEDSRASKKGSNGTAQGKGADSDSRKEPRRSRRKDETLIEGVKLTHPDKVVYPEQRLTKREIAEYYVQVADWVLPYVVDRPLSVVRCPGGRGEKCFFQKHVTEALGPAVQGVEVKEKKGKADYLCIKDLKGLLTLVQFGVLEIHPWGSRADRYDRPDMMVFDLDPDEALPFSNTIEAARLMRETLEHYELESFLKTTGGKGLHVVVPLMRRNSWDEVRSFSEAVARSVVKANPDRFVANMRKEKRKKHVFVDYLRNSQGATSVAAYSTRAKPGATVATPLRWDELSGNLAPNSYTVETIPSRLGQLKEDPWKAFHDVRQSITKRMLEDAR